MAEVESYKDVLKRELDGIYERTKIGKLNRSDRIKELNVVTTKYALAHADAYIEKVRKEEELAALEGRKPKELFRPPNDPELFQYAVDLILYEDLTYSHADKMSIIEYPIMSRHQHELRRRRERSLSDVYTGKDDETLGRYTDHDGIKRRVYDYMTPKRDMALVPTEYLDLYNALDSADLTNRQRKAIDLVFFEGMTQEDAAEEMGIKQPNVKAYIDIGINKIKTNLRKNSII